MRFAGRLLVVIPLLGSGCRLLSLLPSAPYRHEERMGEARCIFEAERPFGPEDAVFLDAVSRTVEACSEFLPAIQTPPHIRVRLLSPSRYRKLTRPAGVADSYGIHVTSEQQEAAIFIADGREEALGEYARLVRERLAHTAAHEVAHALVQASGSSLGPLEEGFCEFVAVRAMRRAPSDLVPTDEVLGALAARFLDDDPRLLDELLELRLRDGRRYAIGYGFFRAVEELGGRPGVSALLLEARRAPFDSDLPNFRTLLGRALGQDALLLEDSIRTRLAAASDPALEGFWLGGAGEPLGTWGYGRRTLVPDVAALAAPFETSVAMEGAAHRIAVIRCERRRETELVVVFFGESDVPEESDGATILWSRAGWSRGGTEPIRIERSGDAVRIGTRDGEVVRATLDPRRAVRVCLMVDGDALGARLASAGR